MLYSTAVLFTTGRLPGNPRHNGVMQVFGAIWASSIAAGFGASENILVAVESSTWTSKPTTGSNISRA
jgi:hypothetical protein